MSVADADGPEHSQMCTAVDSCGLTKVYMESVVHRPLDIIAILPRIQYVQSAINGMYKSGALTS